MESDAERLERIRLSGLSEDEFDRRERAAKECNLLLYLATAGELHPLHIAVSQRGAAQDFSDAKAYIEKMRSRERSKTRRENLDAAIAGLQILVHLAELEQRPADSEGPSERDLCMFCRIRLRNRYVESHEKLPDGKAIALYLSARAKRARAKRFVRSAWSRAQRAGESHAAFVKRASAQVGVTTEAVRQWIAADSSGKTS